MLRNGCNGPVLASDVTTRFSDVFSTGVCVYVYVPFLATATREAVPSPLAVQSQTKYLRVGQGGAWVGG